MRSTIQLIEEIKETENYLKNVREKLETGDFNEILTIADLAPDSTMWEVLENIKNQVLRMCKEEFETRLSGTPFEVMYDSEEDYEFSFMMNDTRFAYFDYAKRAIKILNLELQIEEGIRVMDILKKKFKEKVDHKQVEIDNLKHVQKHLMFFQPLFVPYATLNVLYE